MEERGRTIPAKCKAVYQNTRHYRWSAVDAPNFGAKKLIRAAHAKEKQLLEELVQPPESP